MMQCEQLNTNLRSESLMLSDFMAVTHRSETETFKNVFCLSLRIVFFNLWRVNYRVILKLNESIICISSLVSNEINHFIKLTCYLLFITRHIEVKDQELCCSVPLVWEWGNEPHFWRIKKKLPSTFIVTICWISERSSQSDQQTLTCCTF